MFAADHPLSRDDIPVHQLAVFVRRVRRRTGGDASASSSGRGSVAFEVRANALGRRHHVTIHRQPVGNPFVEDRFQANEDEVSAHKLIAKVLITGPTSG